MRSLRLAIHEYEIRHGDYHRPGTWIPTVSGRRFWLEDPRADEVEPFDIAYGLARIPRFNGMTCGIPYVVGQHSVLASLLVERRFALHGLLHDGHEYVSMDLTSPLKRILGPEYARVEARHKAAVAERFGLTWTYEATAAVKAVDNQLVATEAVCLTPWGMLAGGLPAEPLGFPHLPLKPLPAAAVFVLFAERLNELTGREEIKLTSAHYQAAENAHGCRADCEIAV